MTTIGRIVAFLIAMVGAFGVPWAGATPLSPSAEHAHAYAYDSHHSPSATTHSITERGPPGPTSPFVADDLGTRWVSMRSLVAWKVVPTTYDQLAQLLESPRSRGYNDGQASTAEVGPFVRQHSRVAAKAGALTEREIGSTMENVLEGASFLKQAKATQYGKPGGFGQANSDFDALTRGVEVVDRGGGLRTATLSNGTKVNVRPFSSGDDITLEVVTPGNPALKIRYPE